MNGIRNTYKRKAAFILAAAMVITMAAPSVPSSAASIGYGDPSVIQFDPKAGPDLTCSNYNAAPNYTGGIFTVTGRAGYPLTESADFMGIPTMDIGARSRPVLPEFGVEWPGYVFEGWYNEAGNKVLNLPYAFQYETPKVYEARWRGNNEKLFSFKVTHYRIWNGEDTWPLENNEDVAREIRLHPDEISSIRANTPVSATYRRDIPGYRLRNALIQNNIVRAYADPEGEGTLETAADFNKLTMAVRGKMPNDNLTVAYLYEPDGSEFTLRTECVEVLEDGREVLIQDPVSRGYAAEEAFTVMPPDVTAYLVTGIRLTEGQTPDNSRGVYSTMESGCTINENTNCFAGKMPNQNVTVRYTYERDPNYTTKVTVNTINDHNEHLDKLEMDVDMAPSTVTVEVLDRTEDGYVYPPNITLSSHLTNVQFDQEAKTLTFNTDIIGGTITLTYNEDINNKTRWKRVSYYSSIHGSLEGDTAPRSFRTGIHSIDELTVGSDPFQPYIKPVPENEHYIFDGWYMANAMGSGKIGDKLTGEVNVSEDIKLYANFVEKEGEWFDLDFIAGKNGTINGSRTLHAAKGTLWSQLELPEAYPEENYLFNGWYDEAENQAYGQMCIMSNQTYTARFTPIAGDDGILAVPDTDGQVASNGQGEIRVSGANVERKYAVTDQDGYVISSMTGTQLHNGRFRELPPCEIYYVYEMRAAQLLDVGVLLSDQVDESDMSQPAMVRILALGDNYKVTGSGTEEQIKLTIRPSAPDTVYAVLDAKGNTFTEENSTDVWKMPKGSPLSVEFSGLESNSGYVVVAKSKDSTAEPEDKTVVGSSIYTYGHQEEDERLYTLTMLEGGFVEAVTRDGELIDIEEDAARVTFKEGDQIKINAELEDGSGQEFKQWEVLLGDVSFAYKNRRTQTITISSGDAVLQAVYEEPASATPSNATLDYTPKNGNFSLDPSDGASEQLKAELIDNEDDRQIMEAGRKVGYTVKFDRQKPVASPSEAVRSEMGDEEGLKLPWQLNLSLTRKVDGVNKPLPEDGNHTAGIRALGRLDTSTLGNLEYRLWKVRYDDAGEPWCEEAAMLPDPNEEDSGFTGSFSFEADIGDTLIMTYYKANKVIIKDTKRGVTAELQVKDGHALEDAEGYMDLDMFEPYTDPVTGVVYEFYGLSKKPDSSHIIDTSDPITRTMQLYTVYEAEDDTPWQEGAALLYGEIDIANALKNNGSISQVDRDVLTDAISNAVEVLNRLPRASIQELEETYEYLRAIVDEIRNGPDNPDTPDTPDNPDTPDIPDDSGTPDDSGDSGRPAGGGGHNSSSKSGGGGGGSRAKGPGIGNVGISSYQTYINGKDGSWILLEQAGHWKFRLNSGRFIVDKWANIQHAYNETTETYTYHFNKHGVMDSGWLLDENEKWFYLSNQHNEALGRMKTGWFYDEESKNWYYLNPFTGSMLTGWHRIDGKWYYLEPSYGNGRPLGSMYINGYTPDGYKVDASGAWIQESP